MCYKNDGNKQSRRSSVRYEAVSNLQNQKLVFFSATCRFLIDLESVCTFSLSRLLCLRWGLVRDEGDMSRK